MKIPQVATIDYETKKIERRPSYPPKPVSISIQKPGERMPRFYAWGHPTENNCHEDTAIRALEDVWNNYEILCQNTKFDYDVAVTHQGMKPLSWDRMHDTMYLLFLENPYAQLGLKPSAERLLGMPPEERDIVEDWLKANYKGVRDRAPNGNPEPWGAYISEAPGKLVGKYANGDVVRTFMLFKKLYPEIVDRGMLHAYDVERELMPIMLENERSGIHVDLPLLKKDNAMFHKALKDGHAYLRKTLKDADLNIQSGEQMAAAFIKNRWVLESDMTVTASGKLSVSKNNLTSEMVKNKRGQSVYQFCQKLAPSLATQDTWIDQAERTGGTIHTYWNQVKGDKAGAGTGRFSSTPNFQNVSKDLAAKGDGYVHPTFLKSLPALPLMRKYLLPDPGHVWLHRDYSQQELRVMAHYDDGALLAAYLENPQLDVHGIVDEALQATGRNYPRTKVKTTVFQILYGGGVPAVMFALKCDAPTAKAVIKIVTDNLPGYRALKDDVTREAKAQRPITTWGGREYFVRAPSYSKKQKRFMTYEYMMLNYLIQGSAGDCTKQAIINYHNHPKRQARWLLSVHDENNASSPANRVELEMKILRECMLDVDFALPMLSGGKAGPRWAELQKTA